LDEGIVDPVDQERRLPAARSALKRSATPLLQ
jgi:hypothetical protein